MALRLSLPLALVAIWAFVHAQSAHHGHAAAPTPAAPVDCNSLIMNLADCLPFVQSGSTEEKPQGTCCAGLKTVLKSSPECLCEGFRNSASFGVSLNMTKAMALPAACKVQAPPIAQCGLSVAPSGAPAMSPSSSAGAGAAAGPASTSGAGNELAPALAPAPANTASALFSSFTFASVLLAHIVLALLFVFF